LTELTATIEPVRLAVRCGMAARTHRMVPVRLRSSSAFQSSSETPATVGRGCAPPATVTKVSSRPKCATQAATASSTE
jgi:hypothetical protein